MAEAGSFADRVKQQADIVRVIGEYVRLKKMGQNFAGLCPFHGEKTPSFNVHPVKQFYHCFGCGKGGDVFSFVMEMEKCPFPEAVKIVAEKCGIPIPRPKERTPEERKENEQRTALIEIHREAQAFFVRQLETTAEGRAARAYLEDRGLNAEAIARFGIGYAPSGGDLLLRQLKPKYVEKLLVDSGLLSRDQSGRLFDRFRRRISFPITNESGKIVAFGCRALGDDHPKYLNSPETVIYSKSNVLYHLDRAKESIRKEGFVIVVEGYMDAIAVARAGISNVVAACGTSLGESQVRLLTKYFPRDAIPQVVLNYDPDMAGLTATERAVSLVQESQGRDASTITRPQATPDNQANQLLQYGFNLRIVTLPAGLDPDKFIKQEGAEAYVARVRRAPLFLEYLIDQVGQRDLSSADSKLAAVNSLLPYIQRLPSRLLRTEWATRISARLRIEEPVLRAALNKSAAERRSEVKVAPQLVGKPAKQIERRLIRMLAEAEGFKRELALRLQHGRLYEGLETEKVFAALIVAGMSDEPIPATEIGAQLEERERRLFFEILFEDAQEPTWEEAESCLDALRRRQIEQELVKVQKTIEANPSGAGLRELLERKQELMKQLTAVGQPG